MTIHPYANYFQWWLFLLTWIMPPFASCFSVSNQCNDQYSSFELLRCNLIQLALQFIHCLVPPSLLLWKSKLRSLNEPQVLLAHINELHMRSSPYSSFPYNSWICLPEPIRLAWASSEVDYSLQLVFLVLKSSTRELHCTWLYSSLTLLLLL